jgi:hypothetical protein
MKSHSIELDAYQNTTVAPYSGKVRTIEMSQNNFKPKTEIHQIEEIQ